MPVANPDAHLTRDAFGKPDDKGPPAIEQEWRALCEHRNDAIFLWAGEWNRGSTQLGWVWFWSHLATEGDPDRQPHPAVRASAANVERMLSPLAHEARIRIMQAMYDGPKAAGELSDATGLKGGNLYYHLKELLHAAYVKERNGGYDLTELGCQMLLTVAAIADKVIEDSGEEGLLVAGPWER
jgi:DNA-binding transcriptional ArsR family regulator